MFSQASVILCRGGGMRGEGGVVKVGMHGEGDMCGEGACMAEGVCVVGACMVKEACMAKGACMAGRHA